jgi:acetyl esterase/lipase
MKILYLVEKASPASLRAILVTAVLAAAPAHPASLETYGRLPALEDVVISPDGTRVAFVRTLGADRVVAVSSLATGKKLGVLTVGAVKLRGIAWADNRWLMIESSTTGTPYGWKNWFREWYQLSVYEAESNTGYAVPSKRFADREHLLPVVTGKVMVRSVSGHTMLFVPGLTVSSTARAALLRVDLQGDGEKLVAQSAPSQHATHTWLVDAGGDVAAEQDYEEGSQRWATSTSRAGTLHEIASGHEAFSPPQLLGFGPEPDTLLIQFSDGGDQVWRLLSMRDGTIGPPMAERRQLEAPIEDQDHRMIGGAHLADDIQYVFFDPKMQERWDAIVRAFPGEHLRLTSWTASLTGAVVLVEGARDGYGYELVDMSTHTATPLGEVYEGLGAPLAVRGFTYPAADGLTVPAYLTLPHNANLKNLPLIVLPHGGPALRDTALFDWWSQALAAQGYAVLRPNYRGSTVSARYLAQGYGQWGRKMQTDLSDGVRFLAKKGIVDPQRVCIVGGSYGGYAALAGVTLEQGVYRCAVSVAGFSDLHLMLQRVNEKHGASEKRGGDVLEQRDWDRFLGVNGPSDPALDPISPIRHVDAVTVPVLLIHGRDDTVVPFEQSERMYDALRKASKQVELVALKNEDHWLSRGDTRLQMLQACVTFLRAHNPPD